MCLAPQVFNANQALPFQPRIRQAGLKFEMRQVLVGPAHLLALDREAQEAAFAHRCKLAFGWVDLEFEGVLQASRDTLHNRLRNAFAFDRNDLVIGVTCEAVAPPLQLAVELVQQDIGQALPFVSHHR